MPIHLQPAFTFKLKTWTFIKAQLHLFSLWRNKLKIHIVEFTTKQGDKYRLVPRDQNLDSCYECAFYGNNFECQESPSCILPGNKDFIWQLKEK